MYIKLITIYGVAMIKYYQELIDLKGKKGM